MNIVIKLDKRSWEEMQNTKKYEPTTMNWYEEQIVNGIPLPEGHGRLIDADEVLKHSHIQDDDEGDIFVEKYYRIKKEVFDNIKSIVLADKEEE